MNNKKGMQKNLIIGIIAVTVIVIIAIFIFRGGSEEESSAIQSSENTGSSAKSTVSNEEQKYVEFETELTCELLGATSAEDIVNTMEKTVSIMEEYGYDDEEYNRLKTKYADNDNFKALVISEMEERCPELVDQVSP